MIQLPPISSARIDRETRAFGPARSIPPPIDSFERVRSQNVWAPALEEPRLSFKLRRSMRQHEVSLSRLREIAHRSLALRPFEVQLAGASVLAGGGAIEMKTGEGKSITAALGAAMIAEREGSCHVATSSPYLARRDAEQMRPFFEALGLSVSYVDQSMSREAKRAAYRADIVYASAETFAFDWLEDQLVLDESDRVQRGLVAAIVDEADEVLIDSAKTPLILSGPTEDKKSFEESAELATLADRIVSTLDPEVHLEIWYEHDMHRASLTEAGREQVTLRAAELLGEDPEKFELFDTPYAGLVGAIDRAVDAYFTIQRDAQYIDDRGTLTLVDDSTGQPKPRSRWRDGLTEAVLTKEGRPIEPNRKTIGQITYQNFFRMYGHLSGMSGTLSSVKAELSEVYGLDLVEIPTRKRNVRVDEADRFFPNAALRDLAAFADLARAHAEGQPVLLATTSVLASKQLSARIENPMLLLADVAVSSKPLLRQATLALEVTLDEADPRAHHGTLAELFARHPEKALEFARVLESRGVPAEALLQHRAGLPHAVLNAEQHREEAELIARAGAKGSITVATQMAGRGVDIPLGEGVEAAGGLRVIGVGHQSNIRRDDQLRGRAGRQGARGSSAFYVAPSDSLFSHLPARKLRALAERLFTSDLGRSDPSLYSHWRATVKSAQERAESSTYEARRATLALDDVVQAKRRRFLVTRDELLSDGDTVPIVREWFAEAIEQAAHGTGELSEESTGRIFAMLGEAAPPDLVDRSLENVERGALLAFDRRAEKLAGAELEPYTKRLLLRVLDETWLAYTDELEPVRSSIWFQALASRKPEFEFARVSSEMLDRTLEVMKGNALEKWMSGTRAFLAQTS